MVDNVLLGIVDRMLKGMAIRRAEEAGAAEKTLKDLQECSGRDAFSVVDLLFGFPDKPPMTGREKRDINANT